MTAINHILPPLPLNPPRLLALRCHCQREGLEVTPLLNLLERAGLEEAFDQEEFTLLLQSFSDLIDLSSPLGLHRGLLALLKFGNSPEFHIIKFLKHLSLEERSDLLNYQDFEGKGDTFLMRALLQSHAEPRFAEPSFIDALVRWGSDVTLKDREGYSALHYAIYTNQSLEVCSVLLQHLSREERIALLTSKASPMELTSLHYAALCSDDPKIYALLLSGLSREEKSFLVNKVTRNGNTALHIALIKKRDITIIQMLLASGADPTIFNNDHSSSPSELHANVCGFNSLHCALFANAPIEILESLFSGKSAQEQYNLANCQTPKETALSLAMRRYLSPDILAFLIKQGAEVNARTQQGHTAFWLAANFRAFSYMRLLLDHEADPYLGHYQNPPAMEFIAKALQRMDKVHMRWSQYRVITDETKRVTACSYLNEEQQGFLLILQGWDSHNMANRVHANNLTYEMDVLTTFSDHFYQTRLHTVASVEEAIELLKPTKSHLLIIQGHGPGEDLFRASCLTFGSLASMHTPVLSTGNFAWLEVIKRHIENNGALVFDSCALAREEWEGRENLCQETADYFEAAQGIHVIGSDKNIIGTRIIYQPEKFPCVRYFDSQGQEATVVYQQQSRIKYCGYAEKVIIEDYA